MRALGGAWIAALICLWTAVITVTFIRREQIEQMTRFFYGGAAPTSLWSGAFAAREVKSGGWDVTDVQGIDSTFCNIPRVQAKSVTREAFANQYLERYPVILQGATDTSIFRRVVEKELLLSKYGNYSVILSSANKNSYDKRTVPLREYLGNSYMRPQQLNASGASSWYLFGDNRHEEWKEAFDAYEKPNRYVFGKYASLSFGIGPAGSGVPFHTHGHVFNEVMYGKKRWWLQAPKDRGSNADGPRFDPDASSLQWLTNVRPTYTSDEERELLECVCAPGDLLYIPSFWHHATLNIGETVFMATFV